MSIAICDYISMVIYGNILQYIVLKQMRKDAVWIFNFINWVFKWEKVGRSGYECHESPLESRFESYRLSIRYLLNA